MTDNAGIKTKRGRVRKHSLGEVLYYAFAVPQPDGPRRMVRKARVPRLYKCAHIRDNPQRLRTKAEKEIPHSRAAATNMVLRMAADVIDKGQGRFIRIHRSEGNILRYRYNATQRASTTPDHSNKSVSSFRANSSR